MNTGDHFLPARYYAMVAGRLAEWGVDVLSLLKQAEIPLEVIQAPDGQLTPAQVERLAALALVVSNRSDLGFELGSLLRLTSHDTLGYAMLTAPTLGDALRLVARYFSLITPTYRMLYSEEGATASVRFHATLPLSVTVLHFHLEAIAVTFYEHVNTLLGGALHDCVIYLGMPVPPHIARYQMMHNTRVQFGMVDELGALIQFPKELALRRLPTADAAATQLAETRCARLLESISRHSHLSAWVQMMLRESAEGQPSLPELASILNLSVRTFERRLAEEETSFRVLANAAKLERAKELLLAGRHSITQIAYRLGYTDAANFTRTFKRETGLTPSQFQRLP